MNEAIPVLLKLAKRFEAMAIVHRDIANELQEPPLSLSRGSSIDKHIMKADIFKGIADALRGAIADLRNNI